jgi:tRNA (mo5U34)-methyltransferase
MTTLKEKVEAIPYWYHKIALPDGIVTPGWAPISVDAYQLPEDLTGKRVLDVGAWDGFWTFEALKRGAAEVVAIDDFSDDLGNKDIKRTEWEPFDLCKESLGYNDKQCQRVTTTIEEYCRRKRKFFDVIMFFGTLYHLKHPYKALEQLIDLLAPDGEIYIESAICDDYSPYRGGIGKGYGNNDMVMEYYPYAEYGGNNSNWWVPTLQCLGSMLAGLGLHNVDAWALKQKPTLLPECRGFARGDKKEEQVRPEIKTQKVKPFTVAAVMSVPRLGFQDASFCVFEGLIPLKIPLIKVQGAFWGQCLERGIQLQIDNFNPDVILTIDYDTLFKPEDLMRLIETMKAHDEVDALIPLQVGRAGKSALLTLKSRTGVRREDVPRVEFEPEITKASTGHFGLTLLRTSALMKMEHPWFWGQPGMNNQWHDGRVDDDIYFWHKLAASGCQAYSANRVPVGHLELMCLWPDTNLQPLYQVPGDFHVSGKPETVWK